MEEKVKDGNFVSVSGEVVGQHDGYPFYTIGQRKIGVSLGKSLHMLLELIANRQYCSCGNKRRFEETRNVCS